MRWALGHAAALGAIAVAVLGLGATRARRMDFVRRAPRVCRAAPDRRQRVARGVAAARRRAGRSAHAFARRQAPARPFPRAVSRACALWAHRRPARRAARRRGLRRGSRAAAARAFSLRNRKRGLPRVLFARRRGRRARVRAGLRRVLHARGLRRARNSARRFRRRSACSRSRAARGCSSRSRMAAVEAEVGAGWRGALSLRFAPARERTVIARRRHEGPFCVQQPFYPGDGACHVYLLHPPGGLAARRRARARRRGRAPAPRRCSRRRPRRSSTAAKARRACRRRRCASRPARRSSGCRSTRFCSAAAARGSRPTSISSPARAISAGRRLVLGRPLSGDAYAAGTLEQRTHIHVGSEPLLLERLRWRAGERAARRAVGTRRVRGVRRLVRLSRR